MTSFEEILRKMAKENLYFTSIGNLHIWREKGLDESRPTFIIQIVGGDFDE